MTNTLGVNERARGILRRRRADAESLGGASEIDVAEIDEVLAALQGSDNVSEAMIDAAEAAYDLVPEGFCAHRKGLAKAYLAMSALRAPSNTVDAGGEDAVEAVAKFLEPQIMGHTGEGWKWRQDQERKYAQRLLDETGIASRIANTGGLVEALKTCAKTFRRYGEIHRAKGTTEGNLKASNNDDLAEFCEGVIADYRSSVSSITEPGREG